jgi:hypothetical protein
MQKRAQQQLRYRNKHFPITLYSDNSNKQILINEINLNRNKFLTSPVTHDEFGKHKFTVRFQVLTAANMKTAVFWVVAPRRLVEVYRRYRTACCLLNKAIVLTTGRNNLEELPSSKIRCVKT